MVIECIKCGKTLSVTDRDIGIICHYCGKYNGNFQDRKHDDNEPISETWDEGVEKPRVHIKNKRLVDFRDGMEKHAYEWAAKRPHYPRKFGPYNPDIGEFEE